MELDVDTAIFEDPYIINLMDSMRLSAGNDGGWPEKAWAMTQALMPALIYKSRRDDTVMSLLTIQAHLPLRAIAQLYIESVEQQWQEDTRLPLENYLNTLPGFDLAKVDSPVDWAPEVVNQHGYLIQQFSRMLAFYQVDTGVIAQA